MQFNVQMQQMLQHQHYMHTKRAHPEEEEAKPRESKKKRRKPATKAKTRHKKKPGGAVDGSRRVNIDFGSFGVPGEEPQYAGKYSIIPDGNCGRFRAFGENWETRTGMYYCLDVCVFLISTICIITSV